MLRAFSLALADLADRHLLPVWFKSVALALLACAALGLALWRGLAAVIARYAGGSDLGELAAGLLSLLALWLAWRVIALMVLQFFADEVVQRIEARDYPQLAEHARRLGWREELARALAGAGRALLYNALALPVALVLLVTGIGPALVFLMVNAVLLGRELQDMVWLRHRASPGDPAPLSAAQRLALGGLTTLLLTVPLVNFAAPFLGAACAVHLIHRKGPVHVR